MGIQAERKSEIEKITTELEKEQMKIKESEAKINEDLKGVMPMVKAA